MKKFLCLGILTGGTFVILAGVNLYNHFYHTPTGTYQNEKVTTNYVIKYNDCITQEDFPFDLDDSKNQIELGHDWDLLKVNSSIQRFRHSMDSTLKNLSSIDAHNFIHKEFERSKTLLQEENLTEIRRYYHCEIMRICFDSDRQLNIGSIGQL